jgi:hypothetical protein
MNLHYWKIQLPSGRWKYFSTWSQVIAFCEANDRAIQEVLGI